MKCGISASLYKYEPIVTNKAFRGRQFLANAVLSNTSEHTCKYGRSKWGRRPMDLHEVEIVAKEGGSIPRNGVHNATPLEDTVTLNKAGQAPLEPLGTLSPSSQLLLDHPKPMNGPPRNGGGPPSHNNCGAGQFDVLAISGKIRPPRHL